MNRFRALRAERKSPPAMLNLKLVELSSSSIHKRPEYLRPSIRSTCTRGMSRTLEQDLRCPKSMYPHSGHRVFMPVYLSGFSEPSASLPSWSLVSGDRPAPRMPDQGQCRSSLSCSLIAYLVSESSLQLCRTFHLGRISPPCSLIARMTARSISSCDILRSKISWTLRHPRLTKYRRSPSALRRLCACTGSSGP